VDLLRQLAETRGFFTRAEALDVGERDRDLICGVASGDLVRIKHGYYTYADLWRDKNAEARHLTLARAVQHAHRDAVVMSHITGALAHGVMAWGADLSKVHVTRVGAGAGRVEKDSVHHEGRVKEGEIAVVDGLRVLSADRCVVEAATLVTSEQALVLFDSYLHQRLGDEASLFRRFSGMNRWARTQHLHVPIRMADGRADGPGESRGRWLFWRAGLPAPDLQHTVYRPDGTVAGITDWAWEKHGLLGEFDGRIKYGRLLRPNETPGDAVFREKIREDEIREITAWRMFRLVWSDLDNPETPSRVRRLLHLA
jgi:hypothetical protein